jgi:hypothetical protein
MFIPVFPVQFVKRDETEFDWASVVSQISPGNQLGMNFRDHIALGDRCRSPGTTYAALILRR